MASQLIVFPAWDNRPHSTRGLGASQASTLVTPVMSGINWKTSCIVDDFV